MSPEEQRKQLLISAATYVTQYLGVPTTLEAAAQLVDSGALHHSGGGWMLDRSNRVLLSCAPALLSPETLQKLVDAERNSSPIGTGGAAFAELTRRMSSDPRMAALRDHLHWSESSSAGGEMSASDAAQIEAFQAGAPTRRTELDGSTQRDSSERAALLARLAELDAPAAQRAAATRDNVRNIQRNQLTDLQRELEGLPPLDAA